MPTLESWDDLRYFLAVARAGKLSGAAGALRVNHSTVFRRINQLEDRIEARLFDRDHNGYALTDAGREMLAIAERIEDDMLAIDRQVLGADRLPCGVVTVTTVEEVVGVIAPHLKRFRDRYPGIVLEVQADLRVMSLSRREADVAIRPSRRVDEPDVVGRALFELGVGAYASPEYLEGRPRPERPSDLSEHAIIGFDRGRSQTGLMRWLAEQAPEAPVVYRSNSMLSQLEGARAGLGIALLPMFMVRPHAGLDLLMTIPTENRYKLWVLTHADLRHTGRVRAFVDFIVEALAGERERFEGPGRR